MVATTLYSEKFRKIFRVLTIAAEVCGANVLRDDFCVNWVTWSVIVLINVFFIMTLYTVYVEIHNYGNYSVVLESFCLASTAIQGYTKLLSAIYHQRKHRNILKELEIMYMQYEKKHEGYCNQLEERIKLAKKLVIMILNIYCILFISLVGVPLYYNLILHKRISMMRFIIAGLDDSTTVGFFITNAIQATCIFFGAFGNFASDSLCFLAIAHIPLKRGILQCKFRDLDEISEKHPNDASKTMHLLRDIVQWHQSYLDFSSEIKTCFFWVIFVQICTAFFGIVCTIICLFMGVWPSGFVYLVYAYVILICYCYLGNLIEISNEDVTVDIYDCKWYNLTATEQKIILLMLRESQQQGGITIGDIAPLSLSTALQLTKTIYTFSMVLKRYLDAHD